MSRSKREIATRHRQDAFIAEYTRNGNHITNAAKTAGIARKTYDRWSKDQDFIDRLTAKQEQRLSLVEEQEQKLIKQSLATLDKQSQKNAFVALEVLAAYLPEKFDKAVRKLVFERNQGKVTTQPPSVNLVRSAPPQRLQVVEKEKNGTDP